MSDDETGTDTVELMRSEAAARPTAGKPKSPMSKSMHDGVEVWCDCCSCEAEPYWIEAMQESDEEG